MDLSVVQSFIENNYDNFEFSITKSLVEAKRFLVENDFDLIIINSQSFNKSRIKNLSNLIKRPIITIIESNDDLITLEIMKIDALKHFTNNKKEKSVEKVTKIILRQSYKTNLQNEQKNYFLTLKLKLTRNTELLIFSLDNEGPNLLYQSGKKSFSDFEITKIQNFFYLSVGQGNNYNFGLYELPVPMRPKHLAYAYSFLIPDEFNLDPRNQGKNYCLICYIIPKNNRIFIHHMDYIEKLIKEQVTTYRTINELKNPQNLISLIPFLFR